MARSGGVWQILILPKFRGEKTALESDVFFCKQAPGGLAPQDRCVQDERIPGAYSINCEAPIPCHAERFLSVQKHY